MTRLARRGAIRRGGGGAAPYRPYFNTADWLWNPIPASPVLDADSAAIVTLLSASGVQRSCAVEDFAAKVIKPSEVTGSTPRYNVTFRHSTGGDLEFWGTNPFGSPNSVPIPNGTESLIPPGGFGFWDGHVSVADPTNNTVFNMWQAEKISGAWRGAWGGIAAFNGDGREFGGSSTGAGLARYGAIIREEEVAAGSIDHALFFGTDMATIGNINVPSSYRYPATKTDGQNQGGQATTIDEGTRIQLNPSADLSGVTSPIQLMIAQALKTYGAYCGDNGGARMGFVFEYKPGSTVYSTAGLSDYLNLTQIPWASLRVLNSWNGA